MEQKRQKPTVWAILKPGLLFFISAFSGFSYHKTYAMGWFYVLFNSDNGYFLIKLLCEQKWDSKGTTVPLAESLKGRAFQEKVTELLKKFI